jgi:succinate dehydrogenase / fumarate reductase cytochrome b subunit
VAWFVALSGGEASYACLQSFLASWFGRLILFGFTYALFFHLANGIRHLFWDAGKGFDIPTVERTGLLVVFSSVILTVATWIAAYAHTSGVQ